MNFYASCKNAALLFLYLRASLFLFLYNFLEDFYSFFVRRFILFILFFTFSNFFHIFSHFFNFFSLAYLFTQLFSLLYLFQNRFLPPFYIFSPFHFCLYLFTPSFIFFNYFPNPSQTLLDLLSFLRSLISIPSIMTPSWNLHDNSIFIFSLNNNYWAID